MMKKVVKMLRNYRAFLPNWFRIKVGQIFQRLRIAVCLKKGLRKADCLARYGNEEFAMILPEASIEGAIVVAERLREKIKSHNIVYKDNTISLTMSFGVGGMPYNQDLSSDSLIKMAMVPYTKPKDRAEIAAAC